MRNSESSLPDSSVDSILILALLEANIFRIKRRFFLASPSPNKRQAGKPKVSLWINTFDKRVTRIVEENAKSLLVRTNRIFWMSRKNITLPRRIWIVRLFSSPFTFRPCHDLFSFCLFIPVGSCVINLRMFPNSFLHIRKIIFIVKSLTYRPWNMIFSTFPSSFSKKRDSSRKIIQQMRI